MELYIDNILVFGETIDELKPNMIYKTIDTFNPSAVKTDVSKTLSLPDTVEVNKVFSVKKEKYDYVLVDKNVVIMQGYCVLNNITKNKYKKTYNITLYSNLADFFYNLKGTDNNPKKLSDMKWKWTDIPTSTEESGIIITQDMNYVYQCWNTDNLTKNIKRTCKFVPCECDNYIENTKSIIDNTNALFPLTGTNNSTCWEYSGKKYLLVESNENTMYGHNCFHTTQMPLAISYRDLLLACFDPDNNGGYTVDLDTTFFNDNNPYWTKPYILKDTIKKYDANKETDTFGSVNDNGNFILNTIQQKLSETSVEYLRQINCNGSSTIWTSNNNVLSTTYPIFGNKFNVRVPLMLHTNVINSKLWFEGSINIELSVVNNNTNERKTILFNYTINDARTFNYSFYPVSNNITNEYYGHLDGDIENIWFQGSVVVPDDWTNIVFYIKFKIDGDIVYPYQEIEDRTVVSDAIIYIPANENIVNINENCKTGFYLETDYYNDNQAFSAPTWTKEKLFENMLTPFEYLINYTKMFNLRFLIDSDKKVVHILTWDNFYNQGYKDIDDFIDYSENYISSPKIIDEGNIKFNIEPDGNDTAQKYMDSVDANLFDKIIKVSSLNDNNKDYISSNKIKIGSKNRFTTPFLALYPTTQGATTLYTGFNQQTPYKCNYLAEDYSTSKNLETMEYSLRYYQGVNQYDFLQIKDINNTVVMFEGLKDVVTYKYNDGTEHTVKPAAVIADISKQCWLYAESVPYFCGVPYNATEGAVGTFLYSDIRYTYKVPIFGLCSSYSDYSNGLSYSNISYDSLNVTSNIYDKYFANMVRKIYANPEQVKCKVQFKEKLDMRKIYYFNYNYWIISEVNEYNFNDDFVDVTFIKYQND